ncbi:membrane protein insertase YidC [Carboxylicivirga sediminis]|uniref:Membrane protein insertase YidC n=1 Tax=Carboxylicivirga sediminis TaxID=2006564 RepID=A0A941IYV8_9BACT|nr:membrane protein insertase YidC [Carboxylicivirga sediminis]MBR8536187.1 membrane protein insertase YidC [Carboxylicivirga sediminis]
MDRNSITGIILITIILGFFWWINKPSEEQLAQQQRRRDSIAMVEQLRSEAEAQTAAVKAQQTQEAEAQKDSSIIAQEKSDRFGLFASAAEGEQSFVTLENNLVKMKISTKGARIYSVELKDYKTHDGQPLVLMNGDQNKFGFYFTHSNRNFHTNDLFFDVASTSGNKADFVINAAEGKLVFSYALPDDSYMADFNITTNNMGSIMSTNTGSLGIEWNMRMDAQEKAPDFERQRAGVYFKFAQEDVDHIVATSSKSEKLSTKVQWVAFKDQFFSSVFIAKDDFVSGEVATEAPEDKNERLIMNASALVNVPYTGNDNLDFHFYFGPNDFKALKPYDEAYDLRELVYLGWGFLRYINLGVIEVFHFFEGFISNYGIIILLLTILIKLILFPLTYKSYVSTAKMKVLKPQIEEINNKIPKEKAMERQQATMALYRKAGVNPMGGCLPMLLQMPILFAMFQFFPASIELRGEAFLWAQDLSSYDSIFELPFTIPFYGDHVSLFCLLMAITNIVYTKINQEMTQSSQQMPGMKGMMYMMPVMFLFFFNNYASGLSYYYFISTLITIGQTLLIRRFVDEEALLAKLNANKKKPVKKSKFQQRLEDMQRQQAQAGKKGKKK